MRRALELASRGCYTCAPNPMVGAVLVREGQIVGEGYHRAAGEPHAEIEALRSAGSRALGATLYVTLEPCAHHGRTPPCTSALVEAGIQRVIAAHRDPNPAVPGGGFAALESAGIDVQVGVLGEEAALLNWRFLVSVIAQRPAVSLKWAMSLDGKIATVEGQSQWISSPEGREWGLRQRETHDAILVGSGTMASDDPRLNRRLGRSQGPNTRVILDRRLRTSPRAALFSVPGPVLVYTQVSRTRPGVNSALEAQGAEVIEMPSVEAGTVLADLHERGLQSVLVEGGPTVAASFVASGFFDRVAVNCAPLMIGGADAPGPFGGMGFATLKDAVSLTRLECERCGPDLVLTAFKETCLQELLSHVDV